MTALALLLLLAADPATDGTTAARANVATAEHVAHECWTPRECIVAGEMVAAARAELAAAVALATPGKVAPPKPADPWQVDGDYSEPFASVDVLPESIEAQAAFDMATVQAALDALVTP